VALLRPRRKERQVSHLRYSRNKRAQHGERGRSHGWKLARLGTSRSQTHIHEAPTIGPDGDLSAEEEARRYQHYGLHYGLVTLGAGPLWD
jgi:hypothetical protein